MFRALRLRRGVEWGATACLVVLLLACGAPASTATIPVAATTVPLSTTPRGAVPTVPPTATATRPTAATPMAIPGTSIAASLGARVSLRPGQVASFATEGLSLRFTAVTNESRCPKGPQIACAHAGSATIALEASRGRESSLVELKMPDLVDDTTQRSNSTGASVVFAGYRILMVSLEPQPTANGRPAPQDYVATLLVTAP